MKISESLRIPAAALALGLALFATGAIAAETASAATAPSECAAIDTPAPLPLGASLKAYIDPKTGQLRQPTAAERLASAKQAELEDGLAGSLAGLRVERRADGTKIMNLQGRFMHSMVARIGPDGKVVYECVDGNGEQPAQTQPAAPAEK